MARLELIFHVHILYLLIRTVQLNWVLLCTESRWIHKGFVLLATIGHFTEDACIIKLQASEPPFLDLDP